MRGEGKASLSRIFVSELLSIIAVFLHRGRMFA